MFIGFKELRLYFCSLKWIEALAGCTLVTTLLQRLLSYISALICGRVGSNKEAALMAYCSSDWLVKVD
jgi:hypothetical protein